MVRLVVASLLAGLLASGPVKSPATQPPHTFELVSTALKLDASGTPQFADREPCLYGKYEPGIPVLLLSEKDSGTCPVVTGRVGGHARDGDCTVLEGAGKCEGEFSLGVIGSRGRYRRFDARLVTDGPALQALDTAIAKGNVVEAATARWQNALAVFKFSYGKEVVEALHWPDLKGTPTLARLVVREDTVHGPWVAVSKGEAGTIVGPFTMRTPSAFTLDGLTYLSFDVAVCHGCGGVGTEVHLVEAGKLRRVLESYANAN